VTTRGAAPAVRLATPTAIQLALAIVLMAGCDTDTENGLPYLAGYDFADGSAAAIRPNHAQNWEVAEEDGSLVYRLVTTGEQGEIRAPTAWAVLADHPVGSFVFRGRLKSHADPDNVYRDMCVLFHFRDPAHYYYVHYAATSDEVHNIIGLVNGADRIKINHEPAGESVFRLTDTAWHDFKVTFDAATGEVRAFLDDMGHPILTATDTTLVDGLVGIGSFDDTGSFDDLVLWGEVANR
jgi:hypothetical protein